MLRNKDVYYSNNGIKMKLTTLEQVSYDDDGSEVIRIITRALPPQSAVEITKDSYEEERSAAPTSLRAMIGKEEDE